MPDKEIEELARKELAREFKRLVHAIQRRTKISEPEAIKVGRTVLDEIGKIVVAGDIIGFLQNEKPHVNNLITLALEQHGH